MITIRRYNMAELTLEEAREVYKKSDSLKSLMLTKFSKEELETQEVSQEEFDKTFLELLNQCTKTVFLDEYGHTSSVPTNRIELRNSKNEWLFDIQFDGNERFWFNSRRVWYIFEYKYGLTYNAIQKLMLNLVNTRFNMHNCIPISGDDIWRFW